MTPMPQTPSDPLADLRPGDPADALDTPPGPALEEDSEELAVEVRPMVSQEVHDQMVAEAVAAFHADTTCQGFLHGGGQCGCRYIAQVALQTAVPVMLEEDSEERELEPSSD